MFLHDFQSKFGGLFLVSKILLNIYIINNLEKFHTNKSLADYRNSVNIIFCFEINEAGDHLYNL